MGSLLLLGCGRAAGGAGGGGGGAPDPVTIDGALVRKTADQTAADYSTATIINWSSATYDSNAFFSDSSPSRLTIPAELNTYYVIVSVCVEATSIATNTNFSIEILKGGSAGYDGRAAELRSTAGGATGTTKSWIQCSTPPIQVATGDYFEAKLESSDNSITIEAENSSFAILVVGASVDGALVKNAADQTGVGFSFADITWDTDAYDTGTYHDTGSNTSRITIPVGANGKYGILKSLVHLSSGAGAAHATAFRIMKGDSAAYDGVGSVIEQCGTFDKFWCQVETAPVPLATSDFFEANLFCSDGSVNLEQENSTFSLQVLDTITGALVKKSADQTTADYSTPAVITWNTDVYDTDTLHDTSSDTSRFTVPAGLDGRYAVIRANAMLASFASNGTASLCILKNGAAGYDGFGGSNQECAGLTDMWIQCRTQPVLLTTGDYFEAQLYCSDVSITVTAASSSFSIQVLDEP